MGYGTELQQGIAWQVPTSLPIWPSIHTTFASKKGCAGSFWFGWDRESYQHAVFPKWSLGSACTFRDSEIMRLEVNVKVQYWYADVQMVSHTVFSKLHLEPCFLFMSDCILQSYSTWSLKTCITLTYLCFYCIQLISCFCSSVLIYYAGNNFERRSWMIPSFVYVRSMYLVDQYYYRFHIFLFI
jgi:hypothetical protein